MKKVWELRSHAFPPHYTPDRQQPENGKQNIVVAPLEKIFADDRWF